MEKNKKRKRLIAAFLVSIIVFSFSLVPVGAVDGLYNVEDPKYVPNPEYPELGGSVYYYDESSKLNNYYATNTPCSIAFIYQDTSDNAPNPVFNMQSEIQLNGYSQSGNTVNNTLPNFSDWAYYSDNDIFDEDRQNVFEVFDDFPWVGFTQTNIGEPVVLLDNEGDVVVRYPQIVIHQARAVGLRHPPINGVVQESVLPRGIMLSGSNITLIPQQAHLYQSPSFWGQSSALGSTIAGASGIGGILLWEVQPNTYSNATLHYEVSYTKSNGQTGLYSSGYGLISSTNLYSDRYYTLRLPLIPQEFIELVENEPIIFIDDVKVTMYQDFTPVDVENTTHFLFTVDSVSMTTSVNNWQEIDSFPYDTELTPKVTSHILRMRSGANDIDGDEWRQLTRFLANAASGVLSMELAYGVTLGGILVICIAFGFIGVFLKFFAGG